MQIVVILAQGHGNSIAWAAFVFSSPSSVFLSFGNKSVIALSKQPPFSSGAVATIVHREWGLASRAAQRQIFFPQHGIAKAIAFFPAKINRLALDSLEHKAAALQRAAGGKISLQRPGGYPLKTKIPESMTQHQGNRLTAVSLAAVLQFGNPHPQGTAAMNTVDVLQRNISDHPDAVHKDTKPYMPVSLLSLDFLEPCVGLFHRMP